MQRISVLGPKKQTGEKNIKINIFSCILRTAFQVQDGGHGNEFHGRVSSFDYYWYFYPMPLYFFCKFLLKHTYPNTGEFV